MQAFEELVRLYHRPVVQMLYRMCGELPMAEDAAQEAFIRAWRHLPRYRPRAPFRHWLYRIAINAMRDMVRRRREEVDIEALPLTADGEGPEEAWERQERIAQVRAAVLALPEASRAVLILREYEGLSYREIAQTLGIPVGTVMSRLHYARSRLRDRLASLMEGE